MSDCAIGVQGLGKLYHIGVARQHYRTLRDSLVKAVTWPVRRFWTSGAEPEPADELWAVRDVSFDVQHGEVLGIIGGNGAGKSTLLKILSRITPPTEGEVAIYGRVGSLLEVGTGFHPELSGRENIYLNGAILGMKRVEIAKKFDEIVAFAEVEQFLDTPVKRYSSGMYVRLAFAVAAHLDPEVLLVDEVLAVGDVAFRRKSMGKMGAISREGRTVLFVSHTLSAIRQLCTRAIWIDHGRIRQDGSADEVTAVYEREALAGAVQGEGRWERPEIERKGKDAWVDWVETRDADDLVTTYFVCGDELQLLVGIGGQPRDGFTVDWFIYNDRGEKVAYGSANPMCDVFFARDVRTVRCRILDLPLTSGIYRVRVGVCIWGTRYWDEWETAAMFQVTRCDPYGSGQDHWNPLFGNTVLSQEWSVEEAREAMM